MKILIYQPRVSYYVGGGEVVPLEMAHNFSNHGHEVSILTSLHPEGFSEYFKGFIKKNPDIRIEYLELPDTMKWIYKEKPGVNQYRWDLEAVHVGMLARSFIKKRSYDILNVHYKVDILALGKKLPTVMFLHGVPAKIEYFEKIWFSFDKVQYVSVSEYIGKKWSEMVGGIKYKVFTNGIDINNFYPIKSTKKDIDILYFGRLVPVKGVDYLIKAIKILVDQGLSPKVIIAGQGSEKKPMQQLSGNLKLDDYVEFVDYVPQNEVLVLYNRSKVLATPSHDREGVLTTMLEAAACAVPTVTTDSCSMPEFIDNGINGVLAKPKDSDSLARKLKLCLINDKLRAGLAKEARKKAINWSWDCKSKKLESFFKDVITNFK